MYIGSIDKNDYTEQMNNLSKVLKLYLSVVYSDSYKKGLRIKKAKRLLSSPRFLLRNIWIIVSKKIGVLITEKLVSTPTRKEITYIPDYFSDKRIAVYTCFYGQYDALQNPICHPNNIDYYVITDQFVSNDMVWRKIELSEYDNVLTGLSDVEKNRWVKMHPHLIFGDYEYSVYVDANVVPVTDFTELVNRIGECGIAMFWHKYNNCVYHEALYNKNVLKKVSKRSIEDHVNRLRIRNMPDNYGMTTCNVIAREHHNETCIKMMNEWWEEFIGGCRRDQLSFPYVAWKNGIPMCMIARLGNDVWSSNALYVVDHVNND